MLRVLQKDGVPVTTSAGAVAQVWRSGSRQATLARALSGVENAPIDDESCRAIGELLRGGGTTDIVDAHVALLVPDGGTVLTSDPSDISSLLKARRAKATVVRL